MLMSTLSVDLYRPLIHIIGYTVPTPRNGRICKLFLKRYSSSLASLVLRDGAAEILQ
jgi:hypothetical protein